MAIHHKATELFEETNINITAEGKRHLGAIFSQSINRKENHQLFKNYLHENVHLCQEEIFF